MSSFVNPFPSHEINAPFESLRERTVAPSSMTLRAANWATLPEPEMRTLVSALSKPKDGPAEGAMKGIISRQ